MAQNEKIQVMLSYNHGSKEMVKNIFGILKVKNISVFYNDEDNISDRYSSLSRTASLNSCV